MKQTKTVSNADSNRAWGKKYLSMKTWDGRVGFEPLTLSSHWCVQPTQWPWLWSEITCWRTDRLAMPGSAIDSCILTLTSLWNKMVPSVQDVPVSSCWLLKVSKILTMHAKMNQNAQEVKHSERFFNSDKRKQCANFRHICCFYNNKVTKLNSVHV